MRRLLALNNQGQLRVRTSDSSEPFARCRTALLLIDTSGSMAGTKIEQAQSGALSFARSATLKSYATALAIFGDRAAMVSDPTTDAAHFDIAVSRLKVGMVGRNTNLTDGLVLAGKMVDLTAIVILTDGYTNDKEAALLYASILKSHGVVIICIGTDDADIEFLRQISTRSDLTMHVQPQQLGAALAGASRLLPTG